MYNLIKKPYTLKIDVEGLPSADFIVILKRFHESSEGIETLIKNFNEFVGPKKRTLLEYDIEKLKKSRFCLHLYAMMLKTSLRLSIEENMSAKDDLVDYYNNLIFTICHSKVIHGTFEDNIAHLRSLLKAGKTNIFIFSPDPDAFIHTENGTLNVMFKKIKKYTGFENSWFLGSIDHKKKVKDNRTDDFKLKFVDFKSKEEYDAFKSEYMAMKKYIAGYIDILNGVEFDQLNVIKVEYLLEK